MFAHESIVIKHFETICSVDQGTAVNPKVEAALRIVKNAMEAREESYPSFRWLDSAELGLLNGAKINLSLSGDDFRIYQSFDLNGYSFSRRGAEMVIDYLANLLKEYFWYAQREVKAQEKPKKRTRRSHKTT